jgi:uncharacterized RDD family membrane protein YckC
MARGERVDSEYHAEDAQELITGEAVALALRPTSFVLRAAGAAIDFLVYVGGYILIVVILFTFADQLGLDEALLQSLSIALLALSLVAAPVAVETLSQGKSLGRLAVGARIVRDDGGSIGFRHAFVRALTGVLEVYLTFGSIATLVALLNSRSRRLGDLLAGTYSQHERVSKHSASVYGVPVELIDWSRTADVARMPDALARRVSQFLAGANGFTPASRQRLAASLANEVSVFVSPVPATQPELFLAGVSALRRDREAAALGLERDGLDRLAPVLGGLPRGFPDRG